nr:MAG TPA: hypothetical protein [Caudoviricetes sp.]
MLYYSIRACALINITTRRKRNDRKRLFNRLREAKERT